jgi:hypothetical protein
MIRGFSGAPDAHLVHREPLRADELDRQVIRGMNGFEFGLDEDIEKKLTHILESDAYIRAVQHWERKRHGGVGGSINGHGQNGRWGGSFSNSSLAISYDTHSNKPDPPTPTKQKSKRFSGFEFYRRKLFSTSPPNSPLGNSPPTSQSHLSHLSNDPNREPLDPTRGFHPLISMYYLAREKMERERVYGPGQFASSQLSIQDPTAVSIPTPTSTTAYTTSVEETTVGLPVSTATKPPPLSAPPPTKKDPSPSANTKADYSMQLPRLPAPETSHYSGMSYDTTAAPSPTSPGFHPQPRARDPGLPPPSPSAQRAQAELGQKTMLMPRAPPASTHRRSHSLSQRPTVLRGWGGMFGAGDAVDEHRVPEPPKTVGPEMVTFSQKMETPAKEEESGDGEKEYHAHVPSSPSPLSTGATLVRKFGSMLVGRTDETRRHGHGAGKRGTILGGLSPAEDGEKEREKETETETEKEKGTEKEEAKEEAEGRKETEETDGRKKSGSPTPTSVVQSASQPLGNAHRRAATVLDSKGRTTKHERRSSAGAALLSGSGIGGTIGRHRRPSTGYAGTTRPLADRLFSRTQEGGELIEKKEEEEDEGRTNSVKGKRDIGVEENFKEEDERHTSEKDFKPVFLKGLFRSVGFGFRTFGQ